MSSGQAWAAEQEDIYYEEYLPLCKKLGAVSFHLFREWKQHFNKLKEQDKPQDCPHGVPLRWSLNCLKCMYPEDYPEDK